MKTIKTKNIYEAVIKKSRFIGISLPCHSETEANNQLVHLHKQHPNANHITYAYRIMSDKGLLCRFSDAGEPSGTAGKPIYKHLEGKNLINLIIIVMRYFSGIKLGAGGLTRAYGNTAKGLLEVSDIIPFITFKELEFTLEYKQIQSFEYLLYKLEGAILQQHFDTQAHLTIRLPESNSQELLAVFANK